MTRQETWVRGEIERFVLGNLQEHATNLHSFILSQMNDQRSPLYGKDLKHTINCLKTHQSYAIERLKWYELKSMNPACEQYGIHNVEMEKIRGIAARDKLKLRAMNELMNQFKVIPVSCGGHWAKRVRRNPNGNFRNIGAIVGRRLYMTDHEATSWNMRKVAVRRVWDRVSMDSYNSVVKRNITSIEPSSETPIPAMLMIAVKSSFKSMSEV